MTTGWFVAGTDTGVGKSLVAAALMLLHRGNGTRIAGMKPVASGSHRTAHGLRNEDAVLLASCATMHLPYETINPYAFEPAIAPHIAAADANVAIDVASLLAAYRRVAASVDIVVVEGAGGWRVPLGSGIHMSDVARGIDLPVVLVVGLKLGCLNHALLTAEAIERDGLELCGWVGTGIDPAYERCDDNVVALARMLPAACLGIVPPLLAPTPENVVPYLRRPPAQAPQERPGA